MRACLSVRCAVMFLGALVLLAMPAFTWPQGQLAAKDDLKKAYDENKEEREKLFSGEMEANKKDAKHQRIAKAAAQWYIYRVTIKWKSPPEMEAVHTEF